MTKACVRCAMGASVLSTMLLIGSSAGVAVAEPDTGSGTTAPAEQSQPTESVSSGGLNSNVTSAPTSSGSPFDIRTSLRETVIGIRSILRPATTQRSRSGAGSELDSAVSSTNAAGDALDTLPPPSVTETGFNDPVDKGAETVPQPGLITPLAGSTNSNTSNSQPANPTPAVTVPKPATIKAPAQFGQLPAMAHTIGNTVASVLTSTHQTVAAVPALLIGLPTSTAPVADVITTIEFMLTSVGDSVGAIVALPNELGTLMGVHAQPITVIGAGPEARTELLAGPLDLPGLTPPQTPVAALGSGVLSAPAPAAPVLPPVAPVNIERLTPITEAPLGMSGLTASGAPESFLDRAVSTLLVPISIATLAAVALPGVGGLLIICALGVRIGYRQAKAGWAIHVAGISRFAGSGPLGVVRSGSMVALHVPRSAKVRTPGELRLVERSVEQAA